MTYVQTLGSDGTFSGKDYSPFPDVSNKQDVFDADAYNWASGKGLNSVELYKKSTDSDYTAAVLRSLRDKAPGMPLFLPKDIPVALTGVSDGLTTEDVIIYGPGSLIYKPGSEGMVIERPMGTAQTIVPINIANQTHIVNLATGNSDDTGDRLIKIEPANAKEYVAGDVLSIFSQDSIPMSEQVWGIGYKIFNKQMFMVKNLGINYTAGSAFTEGDIVVTSSGGTGVVRSRFGTATGVLMFDQITGNWNNGDTLIVSGAPKATLSGIPYVLVKGRLYYSFLTNPIIRKMSNAKLILNNVGIKTATDQNAIIGSAMRKAAISVFGQVDPQIIVNIHSLYSKGVQLTSCFGGDGLIRAKSGANNANTSEGAYSYPLEIMGATTGGKWELRGRFVRHVGSTNSWQMQFYGTSENNYHKMGFPVQTEFSGFAWDTWSAGFDQHEAAFDMIFKNFIVRNPGNGKRNLTQAVGLQIRGNGTIVEDFEIYGAVIGILDGSRGQTTGFAYENIIRRGHMRDIGLRCISDVGVPTDNLGVAKYRDLDLECDGLFANSPWSGNQVGILVANVAAHDIKRVRTAKMRGSHWWFQNAGNVRYGDSEFDHSFVTSMSETSSSNIRFDNAALGIVGGKRSEVICGVAGANQQPAAFMRYAGTGAPIVKIKEMPMVYGRSTPLPMMANTNATPGTATLQVDHGLFSYASDAAAKTAGIPIGGDYLLNGARVTVMS